jgi:hypothetical protein
MLKRHQIELDSQVWFMNVHKQIHYQEESFDINEQLSCLGIIRDGKDSFGNSIKIMHPVSFPPLYFVIEWDFKKMHSLG